MRSRHLLSLFLFACVSALAAVELKGVSLGQYVNGPKSSLGDLAGKEEVTLKAGWFK